MTSRALIIGPAVHGAESGLASYREVANSRRWYGEVLKADARWGDSRVVVLPEDELQSVDGVLDAIQSAADDNNPGDTLLVIYVGHGGYWPDLPAAQVHFAVGLPRAGAPHTWLSSSYVYRVMQKSQASLKVLIADCSNSGLLGMLQLNDPGERSGSPYEIVPGVLGQKGTEGTCVLAASRSDASAEGCKALNVSQFTECTAFSGHLLNLLWGGSPHADGDLTLGMIYDMLSTDMRECRGTHGQPRMILNDARAGIPLFSNRGSNPGTPRAGPTADPRRRPAGDGRVPRDRGPGRGEDVPGGGADSRRAQRPPPANPGGQLSPHPDPDRPGRAADDRGHLTTRGASRDDDGLGPSLDRNAGVQVGDGNVQFNYFYGNLPKTEPGVTPAMPSTGGFVSRGHAFISYVREDSDIVDELQRILEAAGIAVWRDTVNLWPGEDWRPKIREAITHDALAFIACFSNSSAARQMSYQNDELLLAIEQLRSRRPNDPWLIPVRFDDCDVPDFDLGGGRTLASLQFQRTDLFGANRDQAARRLVAAVRRLLPQAVSPDAGETIDNGVVGSRVLAGHAGEIIAVSFSPGPFQGDFL